MEGSKRARNYCITIWAVEGEPLLLLDPSSWPNCSFFVYQRELCPETQREHFQAYIELDKAMPYAKLITEWDGLAVARFSVRRGSQAQAIRYCVKPDMWKGENIPDDTRVEGPWFFGEPKNQGERTDLNEIRDAVQRGVPLKRLHEDYFPQMLRYGRAVREYKRISAKPRDFKPLVILIVGPAGTGKSRFARHLASYLGSVYCVPDKHTGFWCDDYDGEDVFLFDEMDGDRIRPKAFNSLCDRYECVLPAHGNAGVQLTSKYIILVSNYLPRYWWRRRSAEQLLQTTRRIDCTWPFLRTVAKQLQNRCPYCLEGLCAFHHP